MNSKIKKTALATMMLGGAFAVDVSGVLPVEENLTEAGRWLGTGVKVEPGPCLTKLGVSYRVVTRTATILWMQVGESWDDTEPC
jgi:hypothetical protein